MTAHEIVEPPGWRSTLYRARHVVYRIPVARWSARVLNGFIGYRLMHRDAYPRVWARRR